MPIGAWNIRITARIKNRNGVWTDGCHGIGATESQAMCDLKEQYKWMGIQDIVVTRVCKSVNGNWVDM